jgi:hypothetical protein
MSRFEDAITKRWTAHGLECTIRSSGMEFFNGYVRLPSEHAGFGATYDQLNRSISVHGGLTYGVDPDGWVGFDTGHAGDYWPGQERFFGTAERTWDMERLIAETESLAEQLENMTEIAEPESSWDCTDDEFQALLRDAKAWRARQAVSS